jgi:tetratricopeptide (TPR) repeat protein
LFRSADLEHYKKGIDYFNAGKFEEAITALEEALKCSVDKGSAYHRLERFYAAEAHGRLGEALLEQGELEKAEVHLDKAIGLGQDYPDRLAMLARIKHIKGDPRAAIELLDRALKMNPSYRSARAERAICLDEIDCHAEAWEELRALAPGDPFLQQTDLPVEKGALPDPVRSHLLKIVQDRGEPKRRVRKAVSFEALGDRPRALAEFESLVHDYPDYPDMRLKFAVLLRQEGRFDEAREHLVRALKRNPNYAEAHLQMGILSLKQDRPDHAREHLRRAAELQPGHPALTLLRALAHIRLGEWRDAGGLLEKPSEVDSERPAALLALLRWAEGEEDQAQDLLAKALEGNPGLGWAATAYAVLLDASGEHAQARRVLEAALGLQPHDPCLRLALVKVLHAQGEWDRALATVDTVLEVEPRRIAALAWKGRLLAERDRHAEAEIFLKMAVEEDGEPARWRDLGRVLLRQGKDREASQALAIAVAEGRTSGEAALELALSYYRQSRPEEGREALSLVDREGAEHPLLRLLVSPSFVDDL